jgi:hypothetical protein
VGPDNSGVYIIVYAVEHKEEFSLYAKVSTLAPLQKFLPWGTYIRICVHSRTPIKIRADLKNFFSLEKQVLIFFPHFPKLNLKS